MEFHTPVRREPIDVQAIRVALEETTIPLGGWRTIIASLLDDIDDLREKFPK